MWYVAQINQKVLLESNLEFFNTSTHNKNNAAEKLRRSLKKSFKTFYIMTSQREAMENPADSDEEMEMRYKHIPTAYDALRKVPQNPMFIQVVFVQCCLLERCEIACRYL